MLLSKMKKDRLIILTTHYLEEAEILGDQIMILDSGKLVDIGKIKYKKIKFLPGNVLHELFYHFVFQGTPPYDRGL